MYYISAIKPFLSINIEFIKFVTQCVCVIALPVGYLLYNLLNYNKNCGFHSYFLKKSFLKNRCIKWLEKKKRMRYWSFKKEEYTLITEEDKPWVFTPHEIKSINNKITFIPVQTNLRWVSNIKCFPKEIETLLKNWQRFLQVAELRKTTSNHSMSGPRIWKICLIIKKFFSIWP